MSQISLVSDDLLFASQLGATVRHDGGTLVRVQGASVPAGTVFVDLNRDAASRLELVRKIRGHDPDAVVVAFCHHQEQELRVAAMAAGASQCVTNGAVQSVAHRLLTATAEAGR